MIPPPELPKPVIDIRKPARQVPPAARVVRRLLDSGERAADRAEEVRGLGEAVRERLAGVRAGEGRAEARGLGRRRREAR